MISRGSAHPIPLPTRLAASLLLALGLVFLGNNPAAADFRLCNNTSSRVGIAIGYKDNEGWTTEGWWNLPARTCETVLKGNLVARYYYVYAIDYDRGGEWMGQRWGRVKSGGQTIGIGQMSHDELMIASPQPRLRLGQLRDIRLVIGRML